MEGDPHHYYAIDHHDDYVPPLEVPVPLPRVTVQPKAEPAVEDGHVDLAPVVIVMRLFRAVGI